MITDMGRSEDGRYRTVAGVDFARQLRDVGRLHAPAGVTSGRAIREHGDEARAAGAEAVTSSGVDLIGFLRRHGVTD